MLPFKLLFKFRAVSCHVVRTWRSFLASHDVRVVYERAGTRTLSQVRVVIFASCSSRASVFYGAKSVEIFKVVVRKKVNFIFNANRFGKLFLLSFICGSLFHLCFAVACIHRERSRRLLLVFHMFTSSEVRATSRLLGVRKNSRGPPKN